MSSVPDYSLNIDDMEKDEWPPGGAFILIVRLSVRTFPTF